MTVSPAVAAHLPEWAEIVAHLRAPGRTRVVDVLRAADLAGSPAVQPRCGVAGHADMLELLRALAAARPSILSVTIDSHTRLRQFDTAAQLLARDPTQLNGYPLIAHGWQRARELTSAVTVPLEVRHGSPDGRDLFAVALAAGISSFEGGGIGYNLPYCKNVPLSESLRAWQEIDSLCGELAAAGVIVDREFFGTLTAVLVPPAISIAVTLLEALAAVRAGVRCVSLAYPQGGELHQDVAALRCLRRLAARYLGPQVEAYPVLHEFMGVFPRHPQWATALILYGGLLARLGGATKVVNKTEHEAHGVPDADANARGIVTTAVGASALFDFVRVDEDRIAEEVHWIEREVVELVEPVLAGDDLLTGIAGAFHDGRLDVPFTASVHARGDVLPRRDRTGAIRFARTGALPLSAATRRRNTELLGRVGDERELSLLDAVTRDIYYFADRDAELDLVTETP
ncbi:methylaspartate mutase [Micromonospora echinospora]|uniref:methylaspartate mutase n=1 Tax=Micromonospora echinospora TaxID=1877 RepID=UPI003CF2B4A7